MTLKAHVNITLDEPLLHWVDTLRGQEPRSTFINQVLLRASQKSKSIFDWDLEERLAEEDIKAGRIKKFKRAKDAIKWLKKK